MEAGIGGITYLDGAADDAAHAVGEAGVFVAEPVGVADEDVVLGANQGSVFLEVRGVRGVRGREGKWGRNGQKREGNETK